MKRYRIGQLLMHLKMIDLQVNSLRLEATQSFNEPRNALEISFADLVARPTAERIADIQSNLEVIQQLTAEFESHQLQSLLRHADTSLKYGASSDGIIKDLENVKNAVEIELRHQVFWHYPKSKEVALTNIEKTWGIVGDRFPSAQIDIQEGTRSYRYGLHTAAVFHMMRVAECGLVRLAAELDVKLKKDKPLSHAQWGEIVGEVEKSARLILNDAAPGDEKDKALNFYNGAASHIRALKDRYRNSVMHSRKSFGPTEAEDAIFHTRSFMSGLAEKLDEKNTRRIKWKL